MISVKAKKLAISYPLKENDVIVVGLSGGPDSMALLSLLLDIRKHLPLSIVAAHVNHNVRKESGKEKKFVEEFCLKHGVLFESMTISSYGDDNFHNEARNIRYQFFEAIVHKYQAAYLMTAHHGDDLIETILMRIVRGSTLKGYSGFQEEVEMKDYKIVRPLLPFTKEDILRYNKIHRVPYVVDRSNFKPKYTRNRYRKVILPFLKKEDVNVHEKFWKFSKILSEYSDYVDREAARAFQKVYHDLTLCIPKYLELEPLLQERVIYKMLEEVYQDDLMLLGDKHVNLIRDLITSRKSNAFLYLPNNVKVVKSYEQLKIVVETGEVASYEIEINDYAILPNGKHLEVVPFWDQNGNDVCRLSSSDVTLPLYVRTRNHGDKMEMKGTNGHRKVKDIMIDAKVPLEERELWPVVVDSKGVIVWLPGLKKSKFNLSKNENCDIIIRYY